MVDKNNNGSLRYIQLKIEHEQAKHLPGNIITDFFTKVEMIVGTGIVDSIPSCIARVEYNGKSLPEIKDLLGNSLIIDNVLEENEGYAYLKIRAPGPIQMIVAKEDDCWVVPPTHLSKNGMLMTIQGTSGGLKRVKDKLELLIPERMKMRITNVLAGDLITAPSLPKKRYLVMSTAVKKGYYDTPRKCTQKDIADHLGIKQGTVAEHLQNAESTIINSWSEQIYQS